VTDPSVHEKLKPQQNNSWNLILYAKITKTVAALTDPIFAASPAWSDTGFEELEWGPCDWMPRGAILPQRGDPCRIAFDNNRTPFIVWWAPAT
jgi:hypothetical protein